MVSRKDCAYLSPCLKGLLLGAFIAGLMLAIVTTLWLKSSKTTSTSTTKKMSLILKVIFVHVP